MARHTGNRVGRPRGIPMTDEQKARISAANRERWKDPAFRKRMLKILRETAPIAHAASLKVTREQAYREYMREIAKRHPNRLPAMTPDQRQFYHKLKQCNGYSRAEALNYVFAP